VSHESDFETYNTPTKAIKMKAINKISITQLNEFKRRYPPMITGTNQSGNMTATCRLKAFLKSFELFRVVIFLANNP
jgi:hypothetical protein